MLLNVNNWGPFSADVWGTVSDWVLIIVTLATGVVIFFTFLYQNKDRKLLQIQTKLLIKSYIKKQKPKLSFSILEMGYLDIHSDLEEINDILFTFKSNGNEMIHLKIELKFIEFPERWHNIKIQNYDFVNPNSIIPITASYKAPRTGVRNVLNVRSDIHFIFQFKDIDGNEYEQLCATTFTGPNSEITTNEPRLIKQVL